ncbi:MAG: GGDEF domain-containing protein [Brevinematales bacterium]|nr:GGDEF domain-containing protein [Brevinematales bacterium]
MKRYKIGVLINQLEGMYQSPIWKSIAFKAREYNMDALFFVGKSPASPINFESNENIIYEMINPEDLNGLIFVSGALVNDIGYEEFVKFFNSYGNIPKVSISVKIKGSPAIIIDNLIAMKNLVLHLIEKHNVKKIAFISGLKTHPEAIERLEGYKEALREKNIKFDPELVLPGDFRIESGREAVRKMIYERKIFPDAIVAANDNMAFSAYQELKNLGYNIPDDIILTGFDDQVDIRYTEPPLTTVRQPLEKEGELATEILYQMLSGEKVSDVYKLDCELIIRQSCGCLGKFESKESKQPIDIKEKINFIFKQNLSTYGYFVFQNSEKLKELFLKVIDKKINENEFLKTINNLIISSQGNENFLNNLSNFFESLISEIFNSTDEIQTITMFQKAYYLILMALKRTEGRQKLELDWIMQRFRSLTQNIYSINNIFDLKKILSEQFPQFGVKFFALVLFKEEPKKLSNTKWQLPLKAEIIYYYDQYKKETLENILINTKEILPSTLFPENRYNIGIFSIYNREKQFGYLVMNIEPRHDLLYLYMQEIIGLSLRIILLWDEQIRYSKALEEAYKELKKYNYELKNIADRDVLTGLYNRRGFFEIAETMLKTSKEKDYLICVFFIDLDNLKQINDNLGHLEGDEALKETGNILLNSFRKGDLVARVGGDEFVVIALNKKKSPKLHELILKRLTNELKKYNAKSSKPYILSFSIGHHSFNPYEVRTIEHMITVVDEKLYLEKKRKKSFRD